MDHPIPLDNALYEMEGGSLSTIAAFLLLAGVWHRSEFRRPPLVPDEEIETTGLSGWGRESAARGKFDFGPLATDLPKSSTGLLQLTIGAEDEGFDDRSAEGAQKLAEAIRRAVRSGKREDTAKAVFLACSSKHLLLRTSAYLSALDILALSARDMEYLRYVTSRRLLAQSLIDSGPTEVNGQAGDRPTDARQELEGALTEVLAGRLGLSDWLRYISASSDPGNRPIQAGLMLIHGTVFWGRPTWCIPGRGRLFNFLKSGPRPDVYGLNDYYAWEGSYTIGGYGREVAAKNLNEWVRGRNLDGIDAVTHSHGGNVLLKATHEGCRFGDVLLLSCPVRSEYRLERRAVRNARSVRIKFDLVLVADRARQVFPRRSGIAETVLPIWFHSHSATTEPGIWRKYSIQI